MISEVDLRDWEMVDFELARKAASEDTPDYRAFTYYARFVRQVELLHQKQMQTANKQVAALLKGPDV